MYTEEHQFEPLLPQKDLESFGEQARTIIGDSLRLGSGAHETTRAELRDLVRAMHSYYINRIEVHSTPPVNIQLAINMDIHT